MAEPETVRTAEDRTRITEALAYFRPHPLTKGPVILTADKMREHLAVLEAALRDGPAARIAGAFDAGQRDMREPGRLLATGWIASLGREDDEPRGPVVRFVMDARCEHDLVFADVWSGELFQIRPLPLDTRPAETDGGRDA